EHEPLELARVGGIEIFRVPDNELVAVGIAREVAEHRARVEISLLAPHPLEARLEALLAGVGVPLEQPLPLLALDPAPAPVELEQHVRVEVTVDLIHVDLDLPRSP